MVLDEVRKNSMLFKLKIVYLDLDTVLSFLFSMLIFTSKKKTLFKSIKYLKF